jgi:molybdopterin synthase catalytic subunit
MHIRIQTDDFDLSAEIARLRAANPAIGAVVTFVGTVREMSGEAQVTGMEIEHYPGMTEKTLQEIVVQAEQRWNVIDTLVIHRVGMLQPLDQVVLTAVVSSHRKDAFAACEFIMDYLKTQATFWKKEHTPNGSHWVKARDSDERAVEKWNADAYSGRRP